jgi:hypothetical protein
MLKKDNNFVCLSDKSEVKYIFNDSLENLIDVGLIENTIRF